MAMAKQWEKRKRRLGDDLSHSACGILRDRGSIEKPPSCQLKGVSHGRLGRLYPRVTTLMKIGIDTVVHSAMASIPLNNEARNYEIRLGYNIFKSLSSTFPGCVSMRFHFFSISADGIMTGRCHESPSGTQVKSTTTDPAGRLL